MKKLEKLTFLLLTAFVSVNQVHAQEKIKSTPEERAATITAWMKENLELTPQQEPKVQAINLEYARKNQQIMNTGEPKITRAQAAKASDLAKDNELKKVLTKGQFKLYQDKKEELIKELKERQQQRKKAA